MDLSDKRRYTGVLAELAFANNVLKRSSEVFREHAINDRVLLLVGKRKVG